MGWHFLLLLLFSSAVDFFLGRGISKEAGTRRRKLLLWASLVLNLGLLGFFKYYDFFISSIQNLVNSLGLNADSGTLGLLVPVGISYYTFRKLSYTVDLYRDRLSPAKNLISYLSFVLFFPVLVAGPIDRPSSLLPQFEKPRKFSDPLAADGLRQMLSGFLKKLVIADNLAPHVNDIFSSSSGKDSVTLALGVVFLAFQLYCDFSGYSDIAIGCGKLFGFNLTRNFAFPYFSRDIAEFWRRWHISLSTWLRDYVYVPLCGTRPSRTRKAIGIVATFTICGLWHEARWTFVLWGFIHGLYFLPMTLKKRYPRFIGTPAEGRFLPSLRELGGIALTFTATSFSWILFRSGSIRESFSYISCFFTSPYSAPWNVYSGYIPLISGIIILLVLEWLQRENEHFLQIETLPRTFRWAAYFISALVILVFGAFGSSEFIYAQF